MYEYPCKDCQDRSVGCHSTCKVYQAAKAKHKKKAEDIMLVKKAEDEINDYILRKRG